MLGYYYKDSISSFLLQSNDEILGKIFKSSNSDVTAEQQKAWDEQIAILKAALPAFEGTIFFEFSIPRMGKRIDTLIIIQNVVFIVEFKVGESKFYRENIEQVWDYALDLKNLLQKQKILLFKS